MSILQIKKFIININKIKITNLIKILAVKGKRDDNSVILPIGKFYMKVEKNAEINIADGDLLINSFFSRPDPAFGVLKMKKNSKIIVRDTFTIYSGCNIALMEGAILRLGSGYINSNVKIRCFKEIAIGNDVAISENVTMWDSDAHQIVGNDREMMQSIIIGNHVWIGNNVTVLKGVTVGDGSVIAAGSVVNKSIPDNCLAGGVPARIIRENIQWK